MDNFDLRKYLGNNPLTKGKLNEGKEAKNSLQRMGNYKGHKFSNGDVIHHFEARGDQLEIFRNETESTGLQYNLTDDFWYTRPDLDDDDKAFLLGLGQDVFGSKLTKIQESILNEEYSFGDANVEKAKKAQQILTPKIGPQIEKVFKSLENDKDIEELEAGSADFGLAIGLIAQKVIMDSIN